MRASIDAGVFLETDGTAFSKANPPLRHTPDGQQFRPNFSCICSTQREIPTADKNRPICYPQRAFALAFFKQNPEKYPPRVVSEPALVPPELVAAGSMVRFSVAILRDNLQALDWIGKSIYNDPHLAEKVWGAVPASFAALISKHMCRVNLKNAPAHFNAIAECEDYRWAISTRLPGILQSFNLTYRCHSLVMKHLSLVDPWGVMASPK